MKFIVEPSPLPILIPLGPKYSPHCYNTGGDVNPIVSQASCKMDVTRIYKFIKEKKK